MKSDKTVNVHVTLAVRCVWATMLQWKSNKYYIFWVCVSVALVIKHTLCMHHTAICSLPALLHCARTGLQSAVCPLCNIFPLYLTNSTILKEKKLKNHVLIFYTTFVWSISHCKKNWQRYNCTFILLFMCSTHHSSQIQIKFLYAWQIPKKYSNITFCGSRFVTCGQTDGQTCLR
jgi:hypothetical protein